MQVAYAGTHPVVKAAVEQANRMLRDPAFLDEIASHPKFDMSDAPPAVIAGLMRTSALKFTVETFSPRGFYRIKYRKTFAYTDSRHPNKLFLHAQKLDREIADVAATIIHEGIHALDDAENRYSFGHGDNSPSGKENTAPYWIGSRAYQILSGRAGVAAPSIEEVSEH